MSTESKTTTKVAKKEGNAIAKTNPAERFTNTVIKQFGASAPGEIKVSDFQKKLIQNYFIKMDSVLKDAETKRLSKSEQYRDALEFKWENVNMQKLAIDVVAFSSIGLDPLQPNHINLICYKNSRTNKFDVGFIIGYNGIELKARKYGLDVPDNIVIELVYETDVFKAIKKDANNPIEKYTFEITDEFDRGELKGGFYYQVFNDDQTKNKLVMLSKKDIEKRKPKYASTEFWGGEKPVYKNNKKTSETEKVDGWYNEMAYKTIKRAAWNDVVIDSEKIDDNYHRMAQNDMDRVAGEVQNEIDNNANATVIDIDSEEITDQPKLTEPQPQKKVEEVVDKETGEVKDDSPEPGKQKPLF
ncbi:recombinase RecT [Flagellimonas nanhaiensis]|uniref:Recombinational DNA repair protein (RecE pathway) n=1 Tax=Flagellimonas nanhaiensis TaxID=2292706 RepID=A0A371JNT1_9FLAO|nr:recombinase RecT [Allomuricauda nanhaiensis]RDY58901.1 recombinational DNA repair protein (RecE pathway) [Allomuricauda nanhaiensis]